MKKTARWFKSLEEFFSENPNEPAYDPVHLAGVLVVLLVVIGCLYWLLWTLLVFEGGLFLKIGPALEVLLTSKTLSDFGYQGSPYAMGVFEGWTGNAAALVLTVFVIIVLFRIYEEGSKRRGAA